MDHCSERLRELDDAAFESFVRQFAEAVWNCSVDVSPPSPDHSVDVRLSRCDDHGLLHVERRPTNSPVGVPAVRDLVAIRDRHALDGVTLASTSAVTDSARAVAAECGVSVLGPDALCRLCCELTIEIPKSSADQSELRQAVETYAAYWPASLTERTEELLDAIDGFAAFEHRVAVGDASTVVDFLLDDRAVVKARLGETNFLLYVQTGEEFESIVRLSAYRETQPPLAELLSTLEPRVEQALKSVS